MGETEWNGLLLEWVLGQGDAAVRLLASPSALDEGEAMIYAGSQISPKYAPLFEADARRWQGLVRAWLSSPAHAATLSRLAGVEAMTERLAGWRSEG